jgi:hypothetical protein
MIEDILSDGSPALRKRSTLLLGQKPNRCGVVRLQKIQQLS